MNRGSITPCTRHARCSDPPGRCALFASAAANNRPAKSKNSTRTTPDLGDAHGSATSATRKPDMSTSSNAEPLPPNDIERAEVVLETEPPPEVVAVQLAPTLITAQRVVFTTAAAVSVAPPRWPRRATRAVGAAMRRVFATAPQDSQRKRRRYPPRADFLENSRMEREMHRL